MENKEMMLPLGSIVYLKEGTVKMLIIGRANLITPPEEKSILFDYSAVPYPIGYLGEEKNYYFNNEDIDKVEYEGYTDSEDGQFIKTIAAWKAENKGDYEQGDVESLLHKSSKKVDKPFENSNFGFE